MSNSTSFDTTTEQTQRRLNPFVLPTETNTRFAMLIIASSVLILGIGAIISLPVLMASSAVISGYANSLSLSDPANLSSAERLYAANAFQQKAVELALTILLSCSLPFFMLILTMGMTYHFYRQHSRKILSTKALMPLEREKDVLLYDTVTNLAKDVWAVPPPTIYLESKSPRADGQAWGFKNAYFLRLGNGVRLLLRKQPEAGKAVIRHELAHIVNGDIAPAYFTQALWKTLIYIVLPMFVVAFITISIMSTSLFKDTPSSAFASLGTILQVSSYYSFGPLLAAWASPPWLALVIVLAAIRASILRSREIYADWHAALWGGEGGLLSVFDKSVLQPSLIWRRLWAVHPTSQERAQLLKEPYRLFSSSKDIFFFFGFLVGYLLYGLAALGIFLFYAKFLISESIRGFILWSAYTGSTSFESAKSLINSVAGLESQIAVLITTALGFGLLYFSSYTLGTEIQKQTLLDLTESRFGWKPYFNLGKLAIIFSGGLFLSVLIIFGLLGFLVFFPKIIGVGFVLAIGIACMMWLYLAFVRFFSLRLFAMHQGRFTPRLSARHILTSGTVLVWLMLFATLAGPLFGIAKLEAIMVDAYNTVPLDTLIQIPELMRINPMLSASELNEKLPALQQTGLTVLETISRALPEVLRTSILVSLGVTVFVGLIIWGITWWILTVGQILKKPICTYCDSPLQFNVLAEPCCPSCHQALSPWAFLELDAMSVVYRQDQFDEYMEQAYEARDKSRYHQALQACEQAIHINPNDAEVHNLHGIVLDALRRPEEAKAAYQRALTENPAFYAAHENLAIPKPKTPQTQPQPVVASSIQASTLLADTAKSSTPLSFATILNIVVGALFTGLGFLLAGSGITALIVIGIAWFLNRTILTRILSERSKAMGIVIALQLTFVLLILGFGWFSPDILSVIDRFLMSLYVVGFVWHILDPGFGPSLVTIFTQGAILLPFNAISFVFAILSNNPQTNGVGVILNITVIFFTWLGFASFNKMDQTRQTRSRLV